MQPPDAGSLSAMPVADAADDAPRLAWGPWGRWPWVTYVLPFLVFMLVGMFEPGPPAEPKSAQANADAAAADDAEDAVAAEDAVDGELDEHQADAAELADGEEVELDEDGEPKMPYRYYPHVYTIKIALTVLTMLLVLPGYWATAKRVNGIAILVGVVGVVLWIGICKLGLEQKLLVPMGLGSLVGMGERAGYNPLAELAHNPDWAYAFLAIRLFGLAIVVPIIEEFFVRGFLMPYVMDVDWFKIPFGKFDRMALIVGGAFSVMSHPAELFAMLAWFSLVTWLMLRTRNIWDCVVAHAVTNGLLGAYVIWSGEWQFM